MPNLTQEHVDKVKKALIAVGQADLAAKFTYPMTDFHPCWPALNALEYETDELSRQAFRYIYWNMLGMI